VIAGGDHNYQRYPVLQRDGRTIQYLVAGGSGAPLTPTHRIPDVDRLGPAVHEEGFRCYPLRGDSLARFSRGRFAIGPDEATTIMAERIGITPPRASSAVVGARERRAAARTLSRSRRGLMPVLRDPDAAPQFRSFLRLDASAAEIVISCWAATGCRAHEHDPVLEDRTRATRRPDGRWTWASETPGRAVP
jgi:hypothetical protein